MIKKRIYIRLRWHHVDKETLILLDAELHYNFPHTGGASELIHG
ncbi:HNH endonuclease [Snodgrassella alvi]